MCLTVYLREWEQTLPKSLIEKCLPEIDKLELEDYQTKTVYKRFHYGLDKILFRKFYQKRPSKSFDWLPFTHNFWPLIDHMLFINKNCAISYPYHIENNQLIAFLRLVHHNGFKLEIDEFSAHHAYPMRVIIYKED